MRRLEMSGRMYMRIAMLGVVALALATAATVFAGKDGFGGKGFVTSCADYQWAAATEDAKIATAPDLNYVFSVMEYTKPCDGPVLVTASIFWNYSGDWGNLQYAFEAECIAGACPPGATARAVVAGGLPAGYVELSVLDADQLFQTSTVTGTFAELSGNSTWKITLRLGNVLSEPMNFDGYHIALQGFDKNAGRPTEPPLPTPTPTVPVPR